MNLKKLATTFTFLGLVTHAMANEITIANSSEYTIPVKYQIVYHNPGQSVVEGNVSEFMLNGKATKKINISQDNYQHVGIVVLAVKKDVNDKEWLTLPASARQFDGDSGCWASTNESKPQGNLVLAKTVDANNHGNMSCSDHS